MLTLKIRGLVSAVAIVFGVVGVAAASPDQIMQYQGRVVDANGTPVEGSIQVSFRLFSTAVPDSSTFLWGELHSSVMVSRGVFSAPLGAGTRALDVDGPGDLGGHPFTTEFDGGPRYLQVQINDDDPLTPLTQVGSVAEAFSARRAGAIYDAATGNALDLSGLDSRYVEPSEVVTVPTATTTTSGTVVLAADGEASPGEAVQGSDSRLTGVRVRRNSGAATGRRPQVSFVEGANVTITTSEDAGNDETDVTISATSAATVVGSLQAASGNSKTVTVPGGTLAVDGEALYVWASGTIDGGAGVRIRWGSTSIFTSPGPIDGGLEFPGTWVIEGYLVRTGTNTVVATFQCNVQGQDASPGSQIESFVQPYLAIGGDLSSNRNVTVDYMVPGPSSVVNVLRVRKER